MTLSNPNLIQAWTHLTFIFFLLHLFPVCSCECAVNPKHNWTVCFNIKIFMCLWVYICVTVLTLIYWLQGWELRLTPQQLCVYHPWHLYIHMGKNSKNASSCSCSLLFLGIILPLHLSPVDFHQEEKQTLAVSITHLKAFICNTEGVQVIRDMWKYWDINSCRLDLNCCNKNPSWHFAVFTFSYFSIRKKNHKVDLFNISVVSPRQQWDKMQTFDEAPTLRFLKRFQCFSATEPQQTFKGAAGWLEII